MDWRNDQDLLNLHGEMTDYYRGAPKRDTDTESRHRELLRAHETGWKLVATALERGLRDIADAIRAHR